MPSTRPTPKTASGARRPLVSRKTDTRLADLKRDTRTKVSFANDGGARPSRTEFTESNGELFVSQTRPGYASPRRPLSKEKANSWAKSKDPHTKAMGSYAKNYFKANSK